MKEFDIAEHEFFDDRLEHDGDTLNADYDDGLTSATMYLDLRKKDAVAIAKHFNLTAEDLERG